MIDLCAPTLPAGHGDRLAAKDYGPDFRAREAALRGRDSWKLERRQHFEEPGNASWAALCRGDWPEALRLLGTDERRRTLTDTVREDERRDSFFHRVRVVREPLTPYMQWELNSQRVRAECGERIHVVRAERIAASEIESVLPEVVVLGGRTLYQVLYSAAGVPDGAVRHTEAETIERWESYIKTLYASGEDVRDYVAREVAHLPPPDTGKAGRAGRDRAVSHSISSVE